MKKISIRIDESMLDEIDSYIDHFSIKNRSEALKYVLKKSLKKQRTAVILAKGKELKKSNLTKDLLINDNEYSINAKLINTTMIEEHLKYLEKYKFTSIYILYPKKIIKKIQDIVPKNNRLDIRYIEIDNTSHTADALRLLKGKVHSDFLLIYGDIVSDLDLDSIYEKHEKNTPVCTTMVTSTKNPSIKGSVVIEGNKIIDFTEKKVGENFIISEPIFIMSPIIFDYKGSSLPYDIFPKLAKERTLEFHFSSSKVLHLHKDEDKKHINEFIMNNNLT